MIRLTELRLPLNHPEDALRAAVLARLGIADRALRAMEVFRRGYDARKPQAIMLVYTLDCDVADEAEVLARHAGDQRIMRAPDTAYRFVARAPEGGRRPVVVGTGPCGFMAALLLAQMGLRPLILERGKLVRERTKDTWGLWRRGVLNPESNVQ
ncbi:MAG: FAD-dependent monooxygenase, partial [Alphaproteobacteria bacterium]